MTVSVVRPQFDFMPIIVYQPEGITLLEMMNNVRVLPPEFQEYGIICVNGHPVPRNQWAYVKPKKEAGGVPVQVDFRMPLAGGGEGGDKNIFATVALLVVAIVGAAITGGALGAAGLGLLGSSFAAGGIGAVALGAAVSLGGALLISALTPPPSLSDPFGDAGSNLTQRSLGEAGGEANILSANGPIPRIVGTHKIFPPFIINPMVYYDGDDEVVEAIYALAGPHSIGDIKIAGAPIGQLSNLEFEIRNGWAGDSLLSLITRQSHSTQHQTEIRGFIVSSEDGRTLETNQDIIDDPLPQPITMVTRIEPDEFWIEMSLPQGLHKNAIETAPLRVPIRMRMRPVGGEWFNLPELHFKAASIRHMRMSVKIKWTNLAQVAASASSPTGDGWVEARYSSLAQIASPAGGSWTADADRFYSGSGDVYLTGTNQLSSGIRNISIGRYETIVYLNELSTPRGQYEVEILRGAHFTNSRYSSSNYTLGGTVWNLFGVQNNLIAESRQGVADAFAVIRSISVWNEHPTPTSDLALIAIRARNRRVSGVSCMAGGYVKDWNGTSWEEWKITDNPAPHLLDAATGSARPLPVSMIDSDNLVEWRQKCEESGYTCNMIVDDMSVKDAWRTIASCGYASPYYSEIFGVARDYDRSGEGPVQIFTPRNARWGGFRKAFAPLPSGFRVNYRDKLRDYQSRQITEPDSANPYYLEEITIDGLVTEEDVRKRAQFDLEQARLRSTFYSIEVPPEGIVARRGSLVEVSHDSLSKDMHSGRVVNVELDGSGQVSAVTLDTEVDMINNVDLLSVGDILEIEDMLSVGLSMGAKVRRNSSVTVHPLSNITGTTTRLEFEDSIDPTDIEFDTLVSIGPLYSENLRLIVFSAIPRSDMSVAMVMVDEAPELWQ